jgi:RimJ/RimL family protein N-acetyltransferase
MRLTATTRWKGQRVELFVLEPVHVTDNYVAWLNEPSVNRYLEVRWFRSTLESTRDFVAQQLASPHTLFLGMRALALDGRHVGNIKLGPIDRNHGLAEIGIMIGDADARGAGIGSESIQLLSDIACEELKLRKLTAGCYASNLGSTRAFEKAGFHVEGTRRGHFLLDGKPEDFTLLARHL